MAKFVIESSQLWHIRRGPHQLFARKKIDCTCGYTIHVSMDKIAGREWPPLREYGGVRPV